MTDFQFYTPTKIFFGKDTHKNVGEIIKDYGYKKILFHYGKRSIKKIGLYDQVVESLKKNHIDFVEFGGVEPNPKLSLVREGAQICKKEKVDMVLAGGEVYDSAKVIAISALTILIHGNFHLKRFLLMHFL